MNANHPVRGMPTPPNEEERLQALAELGLGASCNEQIERICALARDLFKVPVALVNLVSREMVMCLATRGLDIAELRREDAFCAFTIMQDTPLVVRDAAADARFAGNVFVSGPPHVRFYAGAPLNLRPGINVGTLCIIDTAPRVFSAEEEAHLASLAEMIVSEMRGQHAARELGASQKRMQQTARLAKIGGWEWHVPSQRLIWDETIYRIYGIPAGTPPSHDVAFERYDATMRGKSRRRLAALFASGEPYDVELRGTRPDGETFWVRAMAEAEFEDGKVVRVLGAVQDITERKLAEARIRELAYRDPLTGLPNRVSFIDRLQKSILTAARDGSPLVLIKFNIDHFREINDALGHQAGDALLRALSEGMSKDFGALGTVARLGGDEFAVIMRGRKNVLEAGRLAQAFIGRAGRLLRHDNATLPISLSAGLSIYPDHGTDGETIMKNAKVALFEAKAQSRGSVVMFAPVMRQAIDQTNTLVRRIRNGIANNEFTLFYQPIVSLRDGKVSGLEALMRWRDPERGVLTPSHFMVGFEQPDLAVTLGDLALDLAVGQMRAWLDAGIDFGAVSVNLSAPQFRLGNLAETILGKLDRAGVAPERLILEVTENVYMGWGADVVAATVRKLHKAGVGIALDDFGTGYASLTHLRQFPVDKLKIDKSFVQARDSGAIVDAVINMGLSLGMQVVAEGVEKQEQLSLLRMKGCDYVQGYVFARPLEAGGVAPFIAGFNAPAEAETKTARRA